ncbi:MAG: hypothetical protein AVO35_01305 [Candidatus Aegiribacteria sp. MLS_C]|nr:MAG: hypothetical protein AVO35_01305 [Candidatus Aegiribacteria sp. MLS_C]
MEFEWGTSTLKTEVELYPQSREPDLAGLFVGEWRDPFLVVDASVRMLWDGLLQPAILSSSGIYAMEAEEILKNTFSLSQIWDSMSSAGINRDTPVVVVGGGLVCDMGALAASTYLRGLPLMLVPTTLLCMVDACLGGKTGVNLSGNKNQVGTFYPAGRIVISTRFLETLPGREYRSGMAEVIKTALIGDRGIENLLREASVYGGSNEAVPEVVRRSLAVKGAVVEADLTERGSRMVLNLGHTVGHALESASGFRLSHGEAVGLGMLAEAAMAVALGGDRNLPGEIHRMLDVVGLPGRMDVDPLMEEIRKRLERDKKTRRDARTWALPFDWCDCRLVPLTPDQEAELLPGALEVLKV